MKRRWKQSAGFTLVELIVVIAILGILSGVAVPAYSGYVNKANKTADEQLAADVKTALTLAHYAGTLPKGATVVVYGDQDVDTPNTIEGDDASSADAAMKATFGEGYKQSLRLKYGKWADEMGTLLNGSVADVENSTFNGDALGYLLDDVQVVVSALGNFFADDGAEVSDELRQYMKNQGVDPGDRVDASNQNLVANMATMYVADYIVNPANTKEGGDFTATWASNGVVQLISNSSNDGNFNVQMFSDPLASGAAAYARVEALANYVDSQSGTRNYASQLPRAELDSVGDYQDLLSALSAVENAIVANDFDLFCAYYGITSSGTIPKAGGTVVNENAETNLVGYAVSSDGSSQAEKDAKAFLSYMSGLSESVDSLVRDTDMNSSNYFNDGSIQQYVENYMSIGKTLEGCEEGAFVFLYDGSKVVCAPLDY